MYNLIIDQPDNCYGCGACVAACPKSCLTMEKDDLGFKIMHMSNIDNCISCGTCVRVCEAQKMSKGNNRELKRYYAQNKDPEVLMRSSSGGVFSALAEYVFKNDGAVWGVQMDSNGKNTFKCAFDHEELKGLCGSKYVEVDTILPFAEVREQLQTGKLILFSGTPCQIQAMNLFLQNKKYENLILVDLLCYGVQSPDIWQKYLMEINPNHSKLINVQMRHKKPGWEEYAMNIIFEDGKCYCKSRWKDPYLLSYASSLYNRTICSKCKAKTFPRVSDITLGDFWQIDTLPAIPKTIKIDSGVSIVLAHSSKGLELLQHMNDDLYIYELPDNVFTNMKERFSGCSKESPNKEKFLEQVQKMSFNAAVKNNIHSQMYTRLRFKWLKVKRILKRVRNS